MPRRQRNRVLWTHTAIRDLESIVDYMNHDDFNAAVQLLNKVRKVPSKLQPIFNRGRIVPELKEFSLRIYREILTPPWRIIYKISGLDVYVMAVIDSRRNVEDILLDRMIR